MKTLRRLGATIAVLTAAAIAQESSPMPTTRSVFEVAAFPGQAWTSLGDSSPVEHGNTQSEVYVEQGVTLFSTDHGSITFTEYQAGEFGNDTYGYQWNNKVIVQAGGRVNKFFRNGIVSIGSGYSYEDRYVGDRFLGPALMNGTANLPQARGGAIGYVQGWFGWQPMGDRKNRFPGSTWFTAGNIEPVEHKNVIGVGNVEQGVVAARFGRVALVPYAEVRLSGDTQGFDWENKFRGGTGIKAAAPLGTIYTEIGAGYRHESRFVSGLSANGLAIFLNTSFDWNLFKRKGH